MYTCRKPWNVVVTRRGHSLTASGFVIYRSCALHAVPCQSQGTFISLCVEGIVGEREIRGNKPFKKIFAVAVQRIHSLEGLLIFLSTETDVDLHKSGNEYNSTYKQLKYY